MSKLILFLIIIAIIYFVASKTKVVHLNTLPSDERKELDKRSKMKLASKNHFRCKDHHVEKFTNLDDNRKLYRHSVQNRRNSFMDARKLLTLIRNEYLDTQYKFNIPNLPVTSRCPNNNTKIIDREYVWRIRSNIENWNKILRKNGSNNLIHVNDMRIIFIMETSNEFIINTIVALSYAGKTLHLKLSYYGHIERSDDFINGGEDVYSLQLTEIKPVSKSEYQKLNKSKIKANAFMTMSEQLEYVDKVNKMHANE